MDSINPVLECIWFVEEGIRRGDNVRDALLRWADRSSDYQRQGSRYHRDFRLQVLHLLRDMEGSSTVLRATLSPYRENLFQVLLAGFRGEAILADLISLKADVQNQLELDMKSHVETLPFRMLVPLLLFLFPAFLILLFGPITRSFLQSL
ncbi:MAG: hypothetical protein J0L82_09475 [Deltaproteobacteria bacterium]|nr:hypothetical protein [Deltaproteobacteria bacterium]